MHKAVIFILLNILLQSATAQTVQPWIRFTDKKSGLSGYKDLSGKIKIKPRFTSPAPADSFYHILPVMEEIANSYSFYYLLKDGRKIGQDSVYLFDFSFDCESEGKILFQDKKNDRVGYFDKYGKVIIPAIYNYGSPFRNGIAVVLRNAHRKCWGQQDTAHCEHLGWEGGEILWINDKNEILAVNQDIDISNINWYSLKINQPQPDSSTCTNIKAINGDNYSFVDYEKEFTKWFNTRFLSSLDDLNQKKLKANLFTEVVCWTAKTGWKGLPKDRFLKAWQHVLNTQKFTENKLKQISISKEDLNYFTFVKPMYKKFYNACGKGDDEHYPVFDVMITWYKNRTRPWNIPPMPPRKPGEKEYMPVPTAFDKKYEFDYQDHLEFIRTGDRYQLLSVSVKNNQVK